MPKKLTAIALMVALAVMFIVFKPVEKLSETASNQQTKIQFSVQWPNIALLTDVADESFYVPEWRLQEVNAQAQPIDKVEQKRIEKILAW